jgi:hypothetical protein
MKRIQREPLNLVATIIFFGAIVHTFLTARFRKIAHIYQQSYETIEYLLHAKAGPPDFGKKHDKLLFRAQLFYFMGEVEAVFGVWLIPLFVAIIGFHGWSTMVDYVGNVNVADAIFVVVIMAMASSLPIIRFTEAVIAKVSAIGKGTPVHVPKTERSILPATLPVRSQAAHFLARNIAPILPGSRLQLVLDRPSTMTGGYSLK